MDYLNIIHVPHQLKERDGLKESFKACHIQLWNYFKITAAPYQMIIYNTPCAIQVLNRDSVMWALPAISCGPKLKCGSVNNLVSTIKSLSPNAPLSNSHSAFVLLGVIARFYRLLLLKSKQLQE